MDDFSRIADRVPLLSNLTPSGEVSVLCLLVLVIAQYNVVDFDKIGGLPPVMKHLLEAGLLHGDVLTGMSDVFVVRH